MDQELDKTVSFFRFEDLRVYHKATDYIAWVQTQCDTMAIKDNGNLSLRFCQAAQNIGLNIAEGSARSKSQFIYYLKLSKSALRDCIVFTTIARNLDYFSAAQEEHSRNQLMELTKMIGALIGSLQKAGGIDEESD
jgi:four helix bundle protein